MKIKITKVSNNRMWYDNRQGEVFQVRRIDYNSYWVKPNPDDPYSGWNFVPFEHCEIYKEEINMMDMHEQEAIETLQEKIHQGSVDAGWWTDLDTLQSLAEECRISTRFGKALVAEKLCLIHSEVSEAMEGARKNLMDDKLPHRKMIEVELADALIRILDLAGALHLDLAGAVREKSAYNAVREDHKVENRMKDNGKAY